MPSGCPICKSHESRTWTHSRSPRHKRALILKFQERYDKKYKHLFQ